MLFIGYLFNGIPFHFVCLCRRASSHRVSSRSQGRRSLQVDYASMTFFSSLWHFFSSNIKTSVSWPKNYKKLRHKSINLKSSGKITSYENGNNAPDNQGHSLVSESRQLYVDVGQTLVFSWYELHFNLVRCLNLFTITKLFSLIFLSFQECFFQLC